MLCDAVRALKAALKREALKRDASPRPRPMRQTHTYAILDVPQAAYAAVRKRIELAGPEYVEQYIEKPIVIGIKQEEAELIVLGTVALRAETPDPDTTPEAETRARLKDIGQAINERLPEGWGFIVLAFPRAGADRRANYVSNCNREDAIAGLKEWLIRCGHKDDWMQDL